MNTSMSLRCYVPWCTDNLGSPALKHGAGRRHQRKPCPALARFPRAQPRAHTTCQDNALSPDGSTSHSKRMKTCSSSFSPLIKQLYFYIGTFFRQSPNMHIHGAAIAPNPVDGPRQAKNKKVREYKPRYNCFIATFNGRAIESISPTANGEYSMLVMKDFGC